MPDTATPPNPADATGDRPVPDPTVLTTDNLRREIAHLTELVETQLAIRDQRMDAIDEATKLRSDAITHIGDSVAGKVLHERELTEERFASVAQQFTERDTRSEREARDNKVAVDAAFAAQKEAATKQDEANQKAIDKSEVATAEKINKLEQLFKTTTDALDGKIDANSRGTADKIDEVKDRQRSTDLTVGGLIQNGAGRVEQRVEQRAVTAGQLAFGGLIVTVVSLIIGYLIANPPG